MNPELEKKVKGIAEGNKGRSQASKHRRLPSGWRQRPYRGKSGAQGPQKGEEGGSDGRQPKKGNEERRGGLEQDTSK